MSFLSKIFGIEEKGTGALYTGENPDAVVQSELVASLAVVEWVIKKVWRKFPITDQGRSGSCVAQTLAKIMGIMQWLVSGYYIPFSATGIYQQKVNSGAGMIEDDADKIVANGICLGELVPSEKMTDEEMVNFKILPYVKWLAKLFKLGQPVRIKTKDFDAAASTIYKTGKPLMLWFFFNLPEWTVTPTVIDENLTAATAVGVHSTTGVDITLLSSEHVNDSRLWGQQAIIIEDSWGTSYGRAGQRFITRAWYEKRNLLAKYYQNWKFNDANMLPEEATQVVKPVHTFTRDLHQIPTAEFITGGDADVRALQDILKYEGFFPLNCDSTGNFGPTTLGAVKRWQEKHGVNATGYVGPLTREALNKLYAA